MKQAGAFRERGSLLGQKGGGFRKKLTLDAAEDVQKNALQHVKDLRVVFSDFHLHIETSELRNRKKERISFREKQLYSKVEKRAYLSHVSRGVGVLSSEHGSNAKDALSTTSNLKLLIKLR